MIIVEIIARVINSKVKAITEGVIPVETLDETIVVEATLVEIEIFLAFTSPSKEIRSLRHITSLSGHNTPALISRNLDTFS